MAISIQYRRKLERSGWKVGTVAEFLGLSPEEAALIEIQLALSDAVRGARAKQNLSQAALAKKLRLSQSRVAKLESGHPSVSLDVLFRALLALGFDLKAIGRTLQQHRAN